MTHDIFYLICYEGYINPITLMSPHPISLPYTCTGHGRGGMRCSVPCTCMCSYQLDLLEYSNQGTHYVIVARQVIDTQYTKYVYKDPIKYKLCNCIIVSSAVSAKESKRNCFLDVYLLVILINIYIVNIYIVITIICYDNFGLLRCFNILCLFLGADVI